MRLSLATEIGEIDITEKISRLKDAMEVLGIEQDKVMNLTDENDAEAVTNEGDWYFKYEQRVNDMIAAGRKKISSTHLPAMVKLKKLELPKFDSSYKEFHKWKFERYTRDFEDEVKYDYLYSYTTGQAHELVMNKHNFIEAMHGLDDKFGNVHTIMRLLLHDIRSLPVVKDGYFKEFEQFSFMVSNFCDRLKEMGLEREVENSYIMHEIEMKMSKRDLQKWLESRGDHVDERKVKHLVKWLGQQSHIRRMLQNVPSQSPGIQFTNSFAKIPTSKKDFPYRSSPVVTVNATVGCAICTKMHGSLTECLIFPLLSFSEKWEVVKNANLCFLCFGSGHYRTTCKAEKCHVCEGSHNTLLHNPKQVNTIVPEVHKFQPHSDIVPNRCYLPIVQSKLKNKHIEVIAKTVLDSGSELNIISRKCFNRLQLKGTAVNVSIVGAGGNIFYKSTKSCEVAIIDGFGYQTQLECLVLDETCGRVLPVSTQLSAAVQKKFGIDVSHLVSQNGEVDLLIGMAHPHLHQQYSIRGNPDEVCIIETRFGPTIVGPVAANNLGNHMIPKFSVNRASIIEIWYNERLCLQSKRL